MDRGTVRTIIVIGLSAIVIGLTLPNIVLTADGPPFGVDLHYDVVSLTPGSFAEAAGLRAGDHIEPRSISPVGRGYLQAWYLLRPAESLRFTVDRGGHRRDIVLTQPEIGRSSGWVAIDKRTTATLFIIVAATLLLLRPSMMLWGFFLFALGSANGSSVISDFVGPAAAVIANTFLVVAYDILGPLGLLLFATRFPVRSPGGFRHQIERLTPVFSGFLVLPALAFILFVAGVQLPKGTDTITNFILSGVGAIGIAALLAGFVQLDRSQQQRLRWVVAGFAIFYAAVTYQALSVFLPDQGWPPAWTNNGFGGSQVLNGLVVLIPITVAYAVLRHDVLDLNFVIGRGLVYGILTSIAVATFAVIEWIVGGVLAQTKLAAASEVVAAVAIGFWLNGLHSRVDRFVDAVIFRKRHLAEQRLARVAVGLPHSETYVTIANLVVREPVAALGLRSAAFFRRGDDGAFRCEAAAGIDIVGQQIDADSELSVHLNGASGPVMLRDIDWGLPGAHGGANDPVVAIPVFIRHELRAIAFYGGHVTGEAIDPDEMRTLIALCGGASAALDHTAAAELTRRLAEYEQAVAALKLELQSLRARATT